MTGQITENHKTQNFLPKSNSANRKPKKRRSLLEQVQQRNIIRQEVPSPKKTPSDRKIFLARIKNLFDPDEEEVIPIRSPIKVTEANEEKLNETLELMMNEVSTF